ncbi:MAG: DUF4373 domain-containing protein [Winogradskyella sp.]|uniref:DUF7833 domain-containing protein n=1 Tax=Winogradskyella sp. TaxID=1883156 RepID=UPI0017E0E837|nr:DUF4373 domain-containing protein [Winogradskyella sp.]
MAKDSYWFKHDSTAGRGLKMRKMAHIYGHWGKGIYWDVCEILRDQNGYKFESDESSLQLLADLIGCKDSTKFLNWFKDCVKLELFEIEEKYFICPPLVKNMGVWEVKKSNGSKGGRPSKSDSYKTKKPKRNLNHNLNESETKANHKANRNHKIREDKSILIKGFKEEIAKSSEYLDGLYRLYRLRKGSASKLLDDFENHLKMNPSDHQSFSEFKKHFNNWLRQEDTKNRLDKYKLKRNTGI